MSHRRLLSAVVLAGGLAFPVMGQGVRANIAPPSSKYPSGSGGGSSASVGTTYAKAHRYLQVAKSARSANDLDKSVLYLRKILQLPFPKDDASRRFLGPVASNCVVLLKGQGKWKEAEKVAREGLNILEQPGAHATYHVMLLHSLHGEILGQLGDRAGASAANARAEALELKLEAR